jgi:para-aminobenzoate synthetase component 1
MKPQPLAWCDPLTLAMSLGDGPMALYFSSAHTGYSGDMSLLAYGLAESVDVVDFDAIDTLLTSDKERFAQSWFGYIGYEMRHDSESYTQASQQGYDLPRARLMRFSDVYVFDHNAHTLHLFSDTPHNPPPLKPIKNSILPLITRFESNMTRQEYEAKVAAIIDEIHAGNLYQANLTRKFGGEFSETPDGLALFARLCQQSPAPYSAYLRMPDAEILSSSPELFLKIGSDGSVGTRPIKGTAPRSADATKDAALREELKHSAKNRAENLMITDLMRSDLARSCKPGSVKAEDLFDVTEHATIFHMASNVSGTRRQDDTIGALLRNTFPPGSMTGAPKIRAVELCNRLEGIERGIYSGAIGWFGGDGSAELSVVIRTLILQDANFEFQVGGGIVADSTPAGEWQETMDKALGILKTLGIPRNNLEAL